MSTARRHLPDDLGTHIVACGFYPELIMESVAAGLAGEPVRGHLVHHEALFSAEIHRHLSVLVLTPTRLLVSHTDERDEDPRQPAAVSSLESIPVRSINTVSITRVVAHPENYPGRGSGIVETWLTINWGTVRKVDLEPAACDNPECDADHGLTGTSYGEDIVIRMSPAADGEENVRRLLEFGTRVQLVAGGPPS